MLSEYVSPALLQPCLPARRSRVTGGMWLCLLAPGHIPFCLGLKYQTLIIKLLSGDFVAPLMPLKRPFQPEKGCVGRWRERAAFTLVNGPSDGARDACERAEAGCFFSALIRQKRLSQARRKVLHRAGPFPHRGKM